jgi:hypothetical protein
MESSLSEDDELTISREILQQQIEEEKQQEFVDEGEFLPGFDEWQIQFESSSNSPFSDEDEEEELEIHFTEKTSNQKEEEQNLSDDNELQIENEIDDEIQLRKEEGMLEAQASSSLADFREDEEEEITLSEHVLQRDYPLDEAKKTPKEKISKKRAVPPYLLKEATFDPNQFKSREKPALFIFNAIKMVRNKNKKKKNFLIFFSVY